MKRFIALLLCTLTVLSLLPLSVLADSTPTYTWATDGSDCHAKVTLDDGDVEEDAVISKEIKTLPTCVTMGTTTYIARFDNPLFETQYMDIQDIPTVATHNLTAHERVEATCKATGNEAYWKCFDCGKFFSDAEGTSEIPGVPTLPIDITAHGLEQQKLKAATCVEPGHTEHWKCQYCGALFEDKDGTIPTTEAAVTLAAHGLTKHSAAAPTEHDAGNIEYWECNDPSCGKLYLDDKATQPTNKEEVLLPGTEHTAEYREKNEATCETDGNIEYWECTVCHKIFADPELKTEITSVVVPKTGHKEATYIEETDSTYYECGHIAYWQCNACGKYFAEEACISELSEDDIKKPLMVLDKPVLQTLSVLGPTSVELEWTYVADATGYVLYRYVTADGAEKAEMVGSTAVEQKLTDTTLLAGVDYTYFVKAYIMEGENYAYSEASNTLNTKNRPAKVDSVTATATGTTVMVSWTVTEGATGYRIYYSEDETASSYTLAGTVNDGQTTSFQHNGLQPGHIYFYKVCAIADSTEGALSSPAVNVTVPLATPQVTLTKEDAYHITIAWGNVSGADKCIVTVTGTKSIKTTVNAADLKTTLEVPPQGTYTVTVQACHQVSGTTEVKSEESTAKTVTLIFGKPELVAKKADATKIKVSWNTVPGATKYQLYHRDSQSDSYTLISEQVGCSYTHNTVPGLSHYYVVRAVSTKGGIETKSEYSASKCVSLVFGTPAFTVSKKDVSTVELKWSAVDGATGGYYIYRKASNESNYTKMKIAAGITSYKDAVAPGNTYSYYMVAVYGADLMLSSESGVKSIKTTMATPSVTVKKTAARQIKLSWKAISGAKKYYVYVATAKNGTYTKVADVTNSGAKTLTYTYTDLPGKTYYFRVSAYSEQKNTRNVVSKCETAKSSVKALKLEFKAPTLTVKKASAKTVKLSWKAVAGADLYRIYEREGTAGTFIQVAEISGLSQVRMVLPGTSYSYKVVAVAKNGAKEAVSAFSKVKTIKLAFAKPTLTVKKASATTIKLTWKAVSGAEHYRLYVSEGNTSSYTQIGSDIAASSPRSYTFTGAPGKKYYFRMDATMDVGGKTAATQYSAAKALLLPFAKPAITVTKNINNAIIVKWKEVKPATRYVVEVATDSSFSSADLYDCPTLTFQVDGYLPGKYYVRVKAIYEGAGTSESAWSSVKYITLK